MTLGELVDRYLEHASSRRRPIRESTRKTYDKGMKVLARLSAGGPPLRDVGVEEITPRWAQSLYDDAVAISSHKMAEKMIVVLRAAWNYTRLYTTELGPNPFANLNTQPAQYADIFFDKGWLARMIDLVIQACRDGVIDEVKRDFVVMAMSTGARPWSEVLKMRWEDIDFRGQTILFRRTKTRPRAIPLELLEPRARAALDRQLGRCETWVWPSSIEAGEHMGSTTVGNIWPKVRSYARDRGHRMDTLDGRPMTFYQASRHAAATTWLAAGVPSHIVAKLLGHDDPRSIRHYERLQVDHLRESARRVAASMGSSMQAQKYAIQTDRLAQAVEALSDAQRKKLGKTDRALDAWRLGQRKPRTDELGQLAGWMGVTPDYFFGVGGRIDLPRGDR